MLSSHRLAPLSFGALVIVASCASTELVARSHTDAGDDADAPAIIEDADNSRDAEHDDADRGQADSEITTGSDADDERSFDADEVRDGAPDADDAHDDADDDEDRDADDAHLDSDDDAGFEIDADEDVDADEYAELCQGGEQIATNLLPVDVVIYGWCIVTADLGLGPEERLEVPRGESLQLDVTNTSNEYSLTVYYGFHGHGDIAALIGPEQSCTVPRELCDPQRSASQFIDLDICTFDGCLLGTCSYLTISVFCL